MNREKVLEGLTVSAGVAMGQAKIIKIKQLTANSQQFTSVSEENQRLDRAIDRFCQQTHGLFLKMRETVGEEDAMILGGQIHMARDPIFLEELQEEILKDFTAEQAIEAVIQRYLSYFENMEDLLFRQRGADLMDMRNHLLEILLGQEHHLALENLTNQILCIEELSPSMMPFILPDKISGILCESGGVASHCAILARATGIPTIFAVKNLLNMVKEEDFIIFDGSTAQVFVNPDKQLIPIYEKKSIYFNKKRSQLQQYQKRDTVTAEGKKIPLLANITDFQQIHSAVELGAEGVGLFRTEYLFMGSQTLPTEEQQYRSYCRLAKLMDGKPVTIRTLDIGGDKQAPCLPLELEENPFLGHRAVRFCLDHRDIFRTQIRAILRAFGSHSNICIIIPFITRIEEIKEVRTFLAECKRELEEEGDVIGGDIPFGVVVETLAAALLIDQIAQYVDFISVGTNDLTQYITASDRGNVRVAEYYNPFHLAVLRILKYIIHCCEEKGIPITLCGEAVADPRMIPLVLSFGEVALSVSPSEILSVRRDISTWTSSQAKAVSEQVFTYHEVSQIEGYLKVVIDQKEKRLEP